MTAARRRWRAGPTLGLAAVLLAACSSGVEYTSTPLEDPTPVAEPAPADRGLDDTVDAADVVAGGRFEAAVLTGADLGGRDLTGADLAVADLAGADLDGAVLVDALLTAANLRGASLVGADLTRADLSGADLTGADLTDAVLDGVTWNDTICPDGTATEAEAGSCLDHL